MRKETKIQYTIRCENCYAEVRGSSEWIHLNLEIWGAKDGKLLCKICYAKLQETPQKRKEVEK